MQPKDFERLMQRVRIDATTGCWTWTGYRTPKGYGVFSLRDKKVRVHRAAFHYLVGRLDEHLVVDHLCGNRACINPSHLEAVTQAVNVQRGNAGKHWASRTHCPKGHPYEGTNLYQDPVRNNRKCRACNRERMRAARKQRNCGRDKPESGPPGEDRL